ncbi:MAG: hypothetical protein IJ580_06820 [Prevotella sp.]|nr:hypothetical protein [Prevotella sp.]
MELKEGLEFYRRCLEYCKQSMTELIKDKSIPKERKDALIDKLLDRMVEFQKRIETIEELLR